MKKINEMIFPTPLYAQNNSEMFELTSNINISVLNEKLIPSVDLFCQLVNLYTACTIELSKNPTVNDAFIVKLDETFDIEEYKISVDNNKIEVFGGSIRGITYGLMSLLQMIVQIDKKLFVTGGEINDKPFKKFRGIHIYLPPRSEIENFKKLINVFCMLKYNSIFLEIGGGMEYKRHPEVNEQWEKFCEDAKRFPGKTNGVQGHSYYWKDSLHTELAGGSYLSQKEVSGIVNYAKALGIEIIPEVQAFSHCYYLALAHREIAECPDQPFPDSYCPSNEKSYELYFDIADEVIEVFKPNMVSVGHDEIRIIGLCPECQKKSGHELLEYELNRLYDYYKSKNIKMAMWGEKIQAFIGNNGIAYGGVEELNTDKYGNVWRIPATFKAIEGIPKDIFMLDWYHGLGDNVEDWFAEKGFDEIFGNLHGLMLTDWNRRANKSNVLGAEVSTWCLANEYTLGHDGIMMEFVFSAYMLWSETSEDIKWSEMLSSSISKMPWIREAATNKILTLGSEKSELEFVYKGGPVSNSTFVNIDSLLESTENKNLIKLLKVQDYPVLFGEPIDYNNVNIQMNDFADRLIFINSTAKREKFLASYKMKEIESWFLAVYSVIYEDGTTENIVTRYGIHYGDINMDWGRIDADIYGQPVEIDVVVEQSSKSSNFTLPYKTLLDVWRDSLCYFTVPLFDKVSNKTIYAWEWNNPHPEKKIRCIVSVNTSLEIDQKVYLFGVAKVKNIL